MTTKRIRVQGLLDPEVAAEVLQRAEEGRRPISREVEFLVAAGLAAVKAQEAGNA